MGGTQDERAKLKRKEQNITFTDSVIHSFVQLVLFEAPLSMYMLIYKYDFEM